VHPDSLIHTPFLGRRFVKMGKRKKTRNLRKIYLSFLWKKFQKGSFLLHNNTQIDSKKEKEIKKKERETRSK
jgi:hypothetical protein